MESPKKFTIYIYCTINNIACQVLFVIQYMYMSKKSSVSIVNPVLPDQVGRKTPDGQWNTETKYEVAWALLQTGNLRETSRRTKVPVDTIRTWRDNPDWLAIVEEVKSLHRDEMNSKLGKVAEVALEKVQDRLENGDFILNNKTGEIVRKPVNLKDASRVLTDVMGTQVKLDKANEVKPVNQQSVGDMLKTLASEFAKFNRKQENSKAIDVEFKEIQNSIHDQRTP